MFDTVRDKSPDCPQASPPRRFVFFERLHRALGPIAGGIIIDVVDFATFGPIGLVAGPVVGGLVGWWVSGIYTFGTRGRIVFATLAAVYCTVPFTELFPLATLIAATARFREPAAPSADDVEANVEADTSAGEPCEHLKRSEASANLPHP